MKQLSETLNTEGCISMGLLGIKNRQVPLSFSITGELPNIKYMLNSCHYTDSNHNHLDCIYCNTFTAIAATQIVNP